MNKGKYKKKDKPKQFYDKKKENMFF